MTTSIVTMEVRTLTKKLLEWRRKMTKEKERKRMEWSLERRMATWKVAIGQQVAVEAVIEYVVQWQAVGVVQYWSWE
jgi:hypothetical protein